MIISLCCILCLLCIYIVIFKRRQTTQKQVNTVTNNLHDAFKQNNLIAIAANTKLLGDYYFDQAINIDININDNINAIYQKIKLYRQAAIAYNNAQKRYSMSPNSVTQFCSLIAQFQIHRAIVKIKAKLVEDYANANVYTYAYIKNELRLSLMHEQKFKHSLNHIATIRKHLYQQHNIKLNELKINTINDLSDNIKQYIKKINELFTDNFTLYQNIIKIFSSNIFDIIGPKPCDYAFVVMGSLGKNIASSYSDLDLMIILENNNHINFFTLYAQLLCLLIIDIGETPLIRIRTPEMSWMYNYCEKESEGLSVDVDGLPLIYDSRQLLGTPERIIDNIKHIKNTMSNTIDTLTYCPRLLVGSAYLLQSFNELNELNELDVKSNDETEYIKYCLQNFHSQLDDKMYIKHEWFRQFTEGLVGIAQFYKINSTNPCDIITSLTDQKIINTEITHDLYCLYVLISYFLLKNYHDCKSQNQRILIQSQYINTNTNVRISDGHRITTTLGRSFIHPVIVRKISFNDNNNDRYCLVDDPIIISQDMSMILHVLCLLTGFRIMMQCILDRNPMPINLSIDPEMLFTFAAKSNHLNKNNMTISKHKTNQLYYCLINYYNVPQFNRYVDRSVDRSVDRNDNSVCIFISIGIALIVLALKLFNLDAALHIANHIVLLLNTIGINHPESNIENIAAYDKRLPTLYVQFLYFLSRITLYDRSFDQKHSVNELYEANKYMGLAKVHRQKINHDKLQHNMNNKYNDEYNDGSDDVLIFLYGMNLSRIASGEPKELNKALVSYKQFLGRDDITDIICCCKISRIYLTLYQLEEKLNHCVEVDINVNLQLASNYCQQGIRIAEKNESTLAASLYNISAKIHYYENNNIKSKQLYEKSIAFEHNQQRKKGIFIQEALDGLTYF